jgi:hypothetical protein
LKYQNALLYLAIVVDTSILPLGSFNIDCIGHDDDDDDDTVSNGRLITYDKSG